MKLTKREREGFQFLKKLAESFLKGKELKVNEKDFTKLKELGITVERINNKEVAEVKRGKDQPLIREITNGQWYFRGKKTKEYLPFQIKELKSCSDG